MNRDGVFLWFGLGWYISIRPIRNNDKGLIRII